MQIPRDTKYIKVVRGCDEQGIRWDYQQMQSFFWDDDNILELDSDNTCTTL
jgi:hypothetical protein